MFKCLKKRKKEAAAKFKDVSKVLDMWPTENKERLFVLVRGLRQWLSIKETTCNAGDTSSIPGSGRPPGEGNGNPLQYSYLKIPIDKEAWWATVHGIKKESDTS